MTLKDITHGPEWVLWVVFAIFAVTSIILLTGHGANLIAGYNTASKEEKRRYNTKMMCRIVGAGMGLIAILILVMGLGMSVIPAGFVNVFGGVAIVDCLVVIILANTICKN